MPFLIGGDVYHKAKSINGGADWEILPDLQGSSGILDQLVSPDGTLIYSNNTGIMELAPDATTWRSVSPESGSRHLTLSTNTNGHPILIWAGASSTTLVQGSPQPGVAYHGLNG